VDDGRNRNFAFALTFQFACPVREDIMRERDPGRVREPDRETTIIRSGGDGGGGMAIAIVVLLLGVVLLLFLFRGGFGGNADRGDINVNIDAPGVTVPEVRMPDVEVPATGGAEGNDADDS
jgi:hypothetical protein